VPNKTENRTTSDKPLEWEPLASQPNKNVVAAVSGWELSYKFFIWTGSDLSGSRATILVLFTSPKSLTGD